MKSKLKWSGFLGDAVFHIVFAGLWFLVGGLAGSQSASNGHPVTLRHADIFAFAAGAYLMTAIFVAKIRNTEYRL